MQKNLPGIKCKKPDAFYNEYFRKLKGQNITHYCPGCGHGTVHKLIAEAIDDFKIKDRVVFCSPVGCSVFAYYYFDCGNIQCAHGRAPAVATGIRRTLDNAILISYQGDGDLAGIGTGAIIHSANRGENITVFFINNAIYGMTGGQMAPTTLIGQKTKTTPEGRSEKNDGYPIGMAEIINTLKAPVYIERVSLGDISRVMKARKAIRKAISNQVENKGFSFVEILSPCPVNWKMTASASRVWLIEKLEPVFSVKKFRDETIFKQTEESQIYEHTKKLTDKELLKTLNINVKSAEEKIKARDTNNIKFKDQYIKIAGFGGQGVMSAGIIMANCAMTAGLNATWLPSYGPEMRGGTANASVIVSKNPIGAPVIDNPNVLISMNTPSLMHFKDKVEKNGLILVNSSLINKKIDIKDIRAFYIPATDIARDLGLINTANIIMLGIYIMISEIFDINILKETIPIVIKRKNFININIKALDTGINYFENNIRNGK